MKQVDVAIGVVYRSGRILICKRQADNPHLPGIWEFPGGKVAPGETIEACLHREFAEELAIEVRTTTSVTPITHEYSEVTVTLHPFLCELIKGDPQPIACDDLRWITLAELPYYAFPPANAPLLEAVQELFSATRQSPDVLQSG